MICAWKKFPIEAYCMAVVLDFVCSSIIGQMLPLAVKSNVLSEQLLGVWMKSLVKIRYRRRYWKRVVKAQQPLSIYYATTKFEKSTVANYYSAILGYTLNLLLVTS